MAIVDEWAAESRARAAESQMIDGAEADADNADSMH